MKLRMMAKSTPKCPKCKKHMKLYYSLIGDIGYECQTCYARYTEEEDKT
jgi:tRNA(Ile2) C34 agmatinyltransferase TiaS